ncbi:putative inner membrane transport protein [Bordetella bronchiseptica MO149]|uniref:MFS transporter n=1 Tax=Bordetella bronchiseptica TaxID=518 RepID=UPI00028B826C|nr:MFS transporter [Bordetella bronchiseptica]CCJ58359.1 putative inner membrane transport protein [Bordetella bronchiseptica MO149]
MSTWFDRGKGALRKLNSRPLLGVTLACVALLCLAQGLTGLLTLSALQRQIVDATAARVEASARQSAIVIENGVRLGKPLEQYFGLRDLLDGLLEESHGVTGVAVVLKDGRLVASAGVLVPHAARLARALAFPDDEPDVQRQPSGSVRLVGDEAVSLGIPLAGSDGIVRAALVLGWSRDPAFMHALMWRNLQVLALVTAAVALALALALALVLRRGERRRRERGGARARFVLPLVALLLAQGVYAGYTIGMFRDVWLDVVRHNAVVLATGLQRGLDRVLGYGLERHQLRGVDRLFSRTIHAYPLIGSIALVASDGRVLQEVDARGSVTGDAQRRFADDPGYTVSLPLGGPDASRGALALRLDGGAVAAALRDRALDAATVAVVALVVAVELLLLLAVVMNRALPSGQGRQPSADGTDVGGLTRPVMFGYLFACAMPASFLPLFARSLPAANLPLPPGLLIALPISLEMGCGLLAALMAGRLSERKGWRHAVLQGLLLSCVGFVASALAPNLAWFASARGVVGLGYGLTWMGLQALVVSRSPPTHRGRSMAGVVAGLFAGQLSGVAVGAMLMEQLGFRAVFAIGAVLLLLPLAGVASLLRACALPPAMAASTSAPQGRRAPLGPLLRGRGFGMLLLTSVIPFSIAQVGVMSFALPLYLEAEGAAPASIGRIFMIYGVCVVYLGPLVARWVDWSGVRWPWIVLAGALGTAGLLVFRLLPDGLLAAGVALSLLALAGCFAGASQMPYMLELRAVREHGAAGAASVMRAADKLGQMLGPLLIGALSGPLGMGAAMAALGMMYLGATLWFVLARPWRQGGG